jgi:hypothetical protein
MPIRSVQKYEKMFLSLMSLAKDIQAKRSLFQGNISPS